MYVDSVDIMIFYIYFTDMILLHVDFTDILLFHIGIQYIFKMFDNGQRESNQLTQCYETLCRVRALQI